MNWIWYAAGVLTAVPMFYGHAVLKYRRWVRAHSYVAEIEIREHR